jgi:hypothetical protein
MMYTPARLPVGMTLLDINTGQFMLVNCIEMCCSACNMNYLRESFRIRKGVTSMTLIRDRFKEANGTVLFLKKLLNIIQGKERGV